MPNTKSLAEQANAEVGAAAYERRSHEMHNGTNEEQAGEDEAYMHKPIDRGSAHRK